MADQTVRIEDSSRERVALDLVKLVHYYENDKPTRSEVLKLYAECRRLVYGGNPE
jgi:hypothetical protein